MALTQQEMEDRLGALQTELQRLTRETREGQHSSVEQFRRGQSAMTEIQADVSNLAKSLEATKKAVTDLTQAQPQGYKMLVVGMTVGALVLLSSAGLALHVLKQQEPTQTRFSIGEISQLATALRSDRPLAGALSADAGSADAN